jgi:penicillin-binding protein 1C
VRARGPGRRLALVGGASVAALALHVAWPPPTELLEHGPVVSLRLLDRHGRLLREVLSDRRGRCRWVGLDSLPPAVRQATLAAEDQRFERHFGIDAIAIGRAAIANLRARRIVAGGSTVTQQLASLLLGTGRTVGGKLRESLLALRLEAHLSKAEILEQYLNRVGYGNQVFGIDAAARLYFGKPASAMSLAQAATLAVLPRAPARYDPYRHWPRLVAARARLLELMVGHGWLERAQAERAAREDVALLAPERSFRAPHFCDLVLARLGPHRRGRTRELVTTLDLGLQLETERRVRSHVGRLADRGVTNAAVVILDNGSGAVRALVGSGDYFDPEDDGMVNGANAPRQPGSALKPLLYGLALERGRHLSDRVPDLPLTVATGRGVAMPRNYDGRYHGWVTLRTALACSYNVPAVRLAQSIGPAPALELLRRAGFHSLSRGAAHYGVGLALGNGEVTLLELARAYAGLARGGLLPAIRLWDDAGAGRDLGLAGARFLSAPAAYAITDVLADADARRPAFGWDGPLELPFPCAVKTGTSEGYRDNWTIGYTPEVTIGVWAGNFDGRPMRSASGILGAAPLFRELMLVVAGGARAEPAAFPRPPGVVARAVCAISGGLATAGCRRTLTELLLERSLSGRCTLHREGLLATARSRLRATAARPAQPDARPPQLTILSPAAGEIFAIDPVLRPEFQTMRLAAVAPGGVERVQWLVDGKPHAEVGPPFEARWPLVPGRHRIELVAGGWPRSGVEVLVR